MYQYFKESLMALSTKFGGSYPGRFFTVRVCIVRIIFIRYQSWPAHQTQTVPSNVANQVKIQKILCVYVYRFFNLFILKYSALLRHPWQTFSRLLCRIG